MWWDLAELAPLFGLGHVADETERLTEASEPVVTDYPYGAPGIEQRSPDVR